MKFLLKIDCFNGVTNEGTPIEIGPITDQLSSFSIPVLERDIKYKQVGSDKVKITLEKIHYTLTSRSSANNIQCENCTLDLSLLPIKE